jgi:putative DNA primase/helicase
MGKVSTMLASQIQALAPALLGMAPSTKGRLEWRFRNRGSMAVAIAGKDRGLWHDHEAGIGGDALDLIAYTRSCDRKEAWHWGLDWLGQRPVEMPAPVPAMKRPERESDQSRGIDMARTIWREAMAQQGTPMETYLIGRGLAPQRDAPLRFHPACPRGGERLPAMVALMTNPVTNEPTGVHRTYLRADGGGKATVTPAKMMLGGAGVIRLTPDEEVTTALGICEGIENGVAILQHVGWAPIWAAGSAGGISRFPILQGIEALTIFADADDKGAGLTAAYACADHWYRAGREVTIQRPPTGADWLDALQASKEAQHA